MINRRQFVGGSLTTLSALRVAGQDVNWPSPVLDVHLHARHGDDREIDHLRGAGITRAVLLPGLGSQERAHDLSIQSPSQFSWFGNADVRLPDAIAGLRGQLTSGAIGMGELKYPLDIDGPEMRRVYDLAAEIRVPVLMHYQEGAFNSGIARLPALLKAYPKTTFIGHANSWWAHISAEVDDKVGYPSAPSKRAA